MASNIYTIFKIHNVPLVCLVLSLIMLCIEVRQRSKSHVLFNISRGSSVVVESLSNGFLLVMSVSICLCLSVSVVLTLYLSVYLSVGSYG